jgi:hypothetical protein
VVEGQNGGSVLLVAENQPFRSGKTRERGREMEEDQGGRKPLEWVDEGARTLGRSGGGMR